MGQHVSVEYKSATQPVSFLQTEKVSEFFSRAVSSFGINQSQVSGFELVETSTVWFINDRSVANCTMKDLYIQPGDKIVILGKCPEGY